MTARQEYQYAELSVDNSILERFSQEMSPYFEDDLAVSKRRRYSTFRGRLIWHIRNSLSQRQKQTLLMILSGKTERETAHQLGVSQQVVHIYKTRAIKRLREKLKS